MLTDMILEEEFEKNKESWYNPQELEHDLHLAAELGKTLLDRNHELEQALQHMHSTNQEQIQEIEYLTKQVDLLRQMNDHHSKVYEQLDGAARDLEQSNQRIVQDNRLAQHKIQSLTETIGDLQTYMEDLQAQIEDLKTAQEERRKRELAEQRRSLGAQSVSCLKELYDLHQAWYPAHTEGLWSARNFFCDKDKEDTLEVENQTLQRSIQTLQRQISAERSRREAAGAGDRADIQGELKPRASRKGPCLNQSETEEKAEKVEEASPVSRHRRHSDSILRAANADEIRRGHEQMCIRRAEAVKQRGISLLNEVDAQYSALQVKYDELLQQCQQTERLSHKEVQTSSSPSASVRRLSSSTATDLTPVPEDNRLPEYKALFQEIFTCIQKTKDDLSESRCPISSSS
ncbi:Cerebellar degeneration-related protein 2 [Oryzias melastigma]|uniref:Cerebellar degeneration-related protein 2 n=1 Tax=Oryzias melastigma TaxID=30732 RepID=A0A834BZF6_ORYME|nr:Cerebellar degeneration-related protein 2 [Oryzias melastigma]